VVCDAGIDELSNVRMIEARQHSLLGPESIEAIRRRQGLAHQLQGDPLRQILANREENSTHATTPDLALQAVRPDGSPPLVARRRSAGSKEMLRGTSGGVEELPGPRVMPDERLHLAPQPVIVAARTVQV